MNSRVVFYLRIAGSLTILLALVIGVIVLARPKSQAISYKGKLNVIAAEDFYGNIASQLGGSYVQVTSIITNPNTDPHLYESNANNALDISRANLVIYNGLNYDDFINRLINASPNPNRLDISAAAVLNYSGNYANPHLWYDIPKMPQLASKITASYIKLDKTHKTYYIKRLRSFDHSLDPLLASISDIKSNYAGQPVGYTEPVPGYLLSAASLRVVSPPAFSQAIMNGLDPSPAATQVMNQLIINNKLKVLLYNTQTITPVTQSLKKLALAHNVPIIGVSETMPAKYTTYQAWQEAQIKQLIKVLKAANNV